MKLVFRILGAASLAAFFFIAACSDALAQTSWEVGLKAGMGGAKLTGDAIESFAFYFDESNYLEGDLGDMRMGFVGGGYATAHFNKQFAMRLEALYVQKGGKGDFTGEFDGFPFEAEVTFGFDYIEFPILAVVSFPAGTSGTFDIFAGPSVAFNLSAEVETEAGGESASMDVENATSAVFGGIVGAGFTLALESVNLFADARWEWGFTNIIDDDSEIDIDIKNNALAFMVGVGFPLGGSKQ